MRPMTESEYVDFLRAGTRTAKLAVTLPSGRPTVTPVWFVWEDDGVLRFNTGIDTAKARSLAADPRVALVVDLEEPPYAFVRVEGAVRLVRDPPEVRRVATAIGGRYMGLDRAQEFGRRNGGDDELVVEVYPTRIVAITDVTG